MRTIYLTLILLAAMKVGLSSADSCCGMDKDQMRQEQHGGGMCDSKKQYPMSMKDMKDQDHDQPMCPKKIFFKMMDMMIDNSETLALSDDQIIQLKHLKTETKKKLITQSAQIEVSQINIKAEMDEDNWSADQVEKLIDSKFDLMKEEAKILLRAFGTARSTLTQEQQIELKKMCPASQHKPGKVDGMKMDIPDHGASILPGKTSRNKEAGVDAFDKPGTSSGRVRDDSDKIKMMDNSIIHNN